MKRKKRMWTTTSGTPLGSGKKRGSTRKGSQGVSRAEEPEGNPTGPSPIEQPDLGVLRGEDEEELSPEILQERQGEWLTSLFPDPDEGHTPDGCVFITCTQCFWEFQVMADEVRKNGGWCACPKCSRKFEIFF
jgi:hypothetical protein